MSATTTKTIDQLAIGDTIVALNGHELPATRHVVVARPLATEDGQASVKLLPLYKSVIEHRLYPGQVHGEIVVIPRPAKKQVTRTVDGVTWTKSATPNREGGVMWTAEDGRYELGRYLVGNSCCDAHPVRISTEFRDAVKAAYRKNDGSIYRFDPALREAVLEGKKGYFCQGNDTHEGWAWGAYDVLTGEALVVPNYSTLKDAAVDAAHAITTGARGL